jgi:hypothetical protein
VVLLLIGLAAIAVGMYRGYQEEKEKQEGK